MIYLSLFSSSKLIDPRFVARGIKGQTQGPVSSTPTIVIPDIRQLAYDAYKANIDVFLAATSLKKTIPTTAQSLGYTPRASSLPIPYPRVVVAFDPKLKEEHRDAALKLLRLHSVADLIHIEGNPKQPFMYTFVPTSRYSIAKLLPIFIECPTIGNTCTPSGFLAIYHVYQAIELYLTVNTYPAFKTSDEDTAAVPSGEFKRDQSAVYSGLENRKKARYGNVSMTHEPRDDPKAAKYKETGMWIGEKSDLDHGDPYVSLGNDAVYSARPTTTSNISFGLPHHVPSMPGLLFPFFNGMNSPDVGFLRRMMSRIFLRCMDKDDCRAAFATFRSDVSTSGSTMEGIICTHILKGIEISLDSQTQLHVLVDGTSYLGFVILGSRWRILIGNQWVVPVSASDLATELSTLRTHASSLLRIARLISDAGLIVDESEIRTPMELAMKLPLIKWEGTEEETTQRQKDLHDEVSRLDFGIRKVGIGAGTVQKMIEDLAFGSLPEDQYVHFPQPKDYGALGTIAGRALSRFGPTSPSFDISKLDKAITLGKDFASKSKEDQDKAFKEVGQIMVAEKDFPLAAKDLEKFLSTCRVPISSKERSSVYRNHTFKDHKVDSKTKILRALSLLFKDTVPSAVLTSKKKATGVEEIVDMDAFFATLVPSRAGSVAL